MPREAASQHSVLRRLYPEIHAGGFSRVDGTVEFYARVNSLLQPSMTVLDYGAGRGEWLSDDVEYRRSLHTLRGKVRQVIGADVDDAVLSNPSLDRAVVCPDFRTIPLDTDSVDMIVSDNVFEHLDDPKAIAAEMGRILRTGGWICARTPNRWGYIARVATVVPNRRHVAFLKRMQPDRQAMDIFPTRYRVNTLKAVSRFFPPDGWDNFSYYWAGDPAYFGTSQRVARAVKTLSTASPAILKPKLMIFLRKRT